MARKRQDDNAGRDDRPRAPEPISLADVKTGSFADRRHLVSADRFATVPIPEEGVAAFLDSLPQILAGQAFRNLVGHIVTAHRHGRGVIAAIGAHVIKCGLSPVLIDLMKRRIVTGLALNGAGAIHDYEIALGGKTSEDVAGGLEDGSFGMAAETGEALATACERGVRESIGLGNALGWQIVEANLPFRDRSLLAVAAALGLPATVHVAIGTDTVHMHPNALGAAIGEASHIDFRIACGVVTRLAGGVWLNIGSAVILPEVFLKAVTVAGNLGHPPEGLVTANLDMMRQYRPQTNVVERPSAIGLTLIGQHEILLPLVRMGVLVALEGGAKETPAAPAVQAEPADTPALPAGRQADEAPPPENEYDLADADGRAPGQGP